MIKIGYKSECCGCTACASICSHNAIKLEPDTLGFLYPHVDVSICIDCGLCDKVCQFTPEYVRYDNYDSPIAYSLRLKDLIQLSKSQSGGAFYSIAKLFILEGGVVYGAAFSDGWSVSHRKAETLEELENLRMTKYVQSDLRGVFRQIKNLLQAGKKVLFSGTACQVAGLKSYLPNNLHRNLLCIDIICHGVPSPKIWQDYLSYIEMSFKSKIMKVCFRDKRFGWHGARESFVLEDGRELFRRTNNYLYFSGYTLRDSCSNCYFTNTLRVGDITIGDQWGLPIDHPYEKDAKGVSLLLINSHKGRSYFEKAKSSILFEPINLDNFLQPQLRMPTELNTKRSAFIKDYESKGFLYVAKRYGDIGLRFKFKEIIKYLKQHIKICASLY